MNKKWMVGCGGCLGILVILALILTGLGFWGFNAYQDGSRVATAELFGAKPPAGYKQLFAINLPGQNNDASMPMTLMMNESDQVMLFGMRMAFSPDQQAILKSGDSQQIGALIQQAMEKTPNNNANRGDLKPQRVLDLKTSYGSVRALEAILSSKKGEVPVLAAFVPVSHSDSLIKILALMGGSQSEEGFQSLGAEMTRVINESGVVASSASAPTPVAPPTVPAASAPAPAPNRVEINIKQAPAAPAEAHKAPAQAPTASATAPAAVHSDKVHIDLKTPATAAPTKP